MFIPRGQIDRLEEGFVEVSVVKSKPTYKIVDKKPKSWKSLKQINYTAAHAIVVSEDWDFYNHSGYDLSQIKEAFSDSVGNGKKLRGASTISQQLVKNLFLSNERSFIRKVKELTYTMYMERTLTKEKILEIYLNIIEYGKGVYGIAGASRHYFGEDPKRLTAREGAFLAMLLPSPAKHAQSFKDKKLTPFAKKVIDDILKKLVKAKYLPKEQLKDEKSKGFKWEKMPDNKKSKSKSKSNELEFKQTEIENKERAKKSRYKAKRGKSEEEMYRRDKTIEVSEDPTFDDDAIIEDSSGLEEEFSLE